MKIQNYMSSAVWIPLGFIGVLCALLLPLFNLGLLFYYGKLTLLFASFFVGAWVISRFVITHPFCGLIGSVVTFFATCLVVRGLSDTGVACVFLLLFYIYFCSVRIFLKSPIPALFILLLFFIGCALMPGWYGFASFVVLSSLCCITLVCYRIAVLSMVQDDFEHIKSLTWIDATTWALLFGSIIFFGVECQQGLLTTDPLHPIYEYSIGKSYAQSFINTPDLSYLGKKLRFHFLATMIPPFFQNLFQVSSFSAVYFLTPFFFLLITFFLLQHFFFLFPALWVPPVMLFFMPFLNLIEAYGSLFRASILFSPSYFLGFLLILFSTFFFITESYILLAIAAFLLATTKISFFLTIFGGVLLFFLRTLDFKKMFLIGSVGLAIFVSTYVLFLSGAHGHVIYVIAPIIATLYAIPYGWLTLLIVAFFAIIAGFGYKNNSNNKALLFFSAIGLSGICGMVSFTDFLEGSNNQFYIAAYFSLTILSWYYITNYTLQSLPVLKKVTMGTIGSLLFLSMIFYLNRPLLKAKQLAFPMLREVQVPAALINAYAWLGKNSSQNSIVLFGKHYEGLQPALVLYSNTGLLRSALSGKQMFCENYNWKGIMMEPDYAQRFADIMKFYEACVIPSAQSQAALELFYETLHAFSGKGISMSQNAFVFNNFITSSTAFYLSLGKEWCAVNRNAYVIDEIRTLLKNNVYSHDDARNFLQHAGITHIVLEQEDQPTLFLQSITQKIYERDGIIILSCSETLA